MTRILARDYFSAPAFPNHLPVLVVARAGSTDDWAAYIAGLNHYDEPSPDDEQLVADMGVKLSEPIARAFFPAIQLRYRD